MDGLRVVERCRALAAVSDEEGRLTRPFAGAAMARANDLVGGWMRDAGLATRVDEAGNLVGRLAGSDPAAGTLLVGSHLDTVRDAGAFDGPLGVVTAIAVAERLRARAVRLPFDLEVLGFSDEEGLRFGSAYLGSRALAGTFTADLLDLRDDAGTRLDEALRGFGGDPDRLSDAARHGDRLLGYVEVHIEQGPVLDDEGLAVGIVTAIAGATRAEVRFRGRPGHAGTVPMAARRDALCAAAEWILAVEAAGRARPGLLATVGRVDVAPGATNVVPGEAVASLDIRHADDAEREAAVAALLAGARERAAVRDVAVTVRTTLETHAVAVDEALTDRLAASVAALDLPVRRLSSGAGHDAVALADLTGVAMLFVRCAGGLSHHPDEDVAPDDADVAVRVLEDFVLGLAR